MTRKTKKPFHTVLVTPRHPSEITKWSKHRYTLGFVRYPNGRPTKTGMAMSLKDIQERVAGMKENLELRIDARVEFRHEDEVMDLVSDADWVIALLKYGYTQD